MSQTLTQANYDAAATLLGCDVRAIRAVAKVESGGRGGFLPDGRVLVRLENHKLWQYWGKVNPALFRKHFGFDPQVTYKLHKFSSDGVTWKMQHVDDPSREWQAFDLALSLDRNAALLSSSFGMFQPMGFNHGVCGWADVESFFADLQESEAYHLKAFVNFCLAKGLKGAFQKLDFNTIERVYNGGGQGGKYAAMMRAEFQRMK